MARNTSPTGTEVAEQAKQHVFNSAKSIRAIRDKDKVDVTFTPTQFENNPKKAEVENGIVLGQVDVDLGQYQGQYRASLHKGKHHLYMAKVGDTWKGYVEFNGNIALEAKQGTVEEGSTPRDISNEMPKIKFGSVCIQFCISVVVDIPIPPYEIVVPYCWEWCI